ncbi:MAG: hypothetical protein PHU40_12335 [Sulfurimonas sp.]|nr:hypothetical protein [Sulfurimonas sp.]
MSRWIDNFENHGFQTTWIDLKTNLEQVVVNESVPTDVQEAARLKKVIAFLDNALQNLDPELFPISVLTAFNQEASQCNSQIHSFNSNKNIGHITNANNHADNLLSYIRPYMIHEGQTRKTLQSAVRAYSREYEESIVRFKELAEDELNEIKTMKKHIDVVQADCNHRYEIAEEASIKITEYESKLFGDENHTDSIKAKIDEIYDNLHDKYEKLTDLYQEVFEDDDNEEYISIKTALKNAKKELENDAEHANKLLTNLRGSIKNLQEFYTQIFGELDENDKRVGGLKDELDGRLKHLSDYEKDQSERHAALFKKIEGLLPGATSAGLSNAYMEMKKTFDTPIQTWNKVFMGSIGFMLFLTLLSFVQIGVQKGDEFIWFSFVSSDGLETTLNQLLYKLPLFIPLVWLAIFASKRRSENQRLQQEYAHKEALAKSYDSYKTQIEQLGQTNQEMLIKLIDKAINAIAHNASETLDGKHGDGTPINEFMKQAADMKKVFTEK